MCSTVLFQSRIKLDILEWDVYVLEHVHVVAYRERCQAGVELMSGPRIGGWSAVLCVGWYGRGIAGLVWGGVWAGASVKSQGLPPTDSSKNSLTASAVGTSNEPSTAFNIPRSFSESVCIGVISMGYCIYVHTLCWVHMCVYSTQWTCQRGAYPVSSANINPSHSFQSQLHRPISNCHPSPFHFFFFIMATWDFMISS